MTRIRSRGTRNNLIKKFSTIGALCTIATIVLTVLIAMIFNSWQQGVIASLIVVAILLLVEFRGTLESERSKYNSNLTQATEKIVSLLRVHNRYFNDVGMFEMLNNIIRLRETAQKRKHDLARFDDIISRAIEKAEKEIGKAVRIPTGDDELDRSIRLKEAINYAEKYVYALTYDENDYLNRFWNGNFGREYIESNLSAAEKGVDIERIFVVNKSIIIGDSLNNTDSQKRERLIEMSKNLEIGSPRCRVFWAAKEDLPDSLKRSNTSFLVSDDYVGSESNGTSQGENVVGYVSYGERSEVIEPLKDRFKRLRRYTEDIPQNL